MEKSKQTILPFAMERYPSYGTATSTFLELFFPKLKGPFEALIFPCAAATAACSLPTPAHAQAPFNSHQSCYGNPPPHLLCESWQLVHFPRRQLHQHLDGASRPGSHIQP